MKQAVLIYIALVLLAASAACLGQSTTEDQPAKKDDDIKLKMAYVDAALDMQRHDDFLNGELWKTLNQENKLLVVMTLNRGMIFAAGMQGRRMFNDDGAAHLTFAQIIIGIDDCYNNDPKNSKIAIIGCYMWQRERSNGATNDELEDSAKNLRGEPVHTPLWPHQVESLEGKAK
jgi:hypothetical protein